MPTIIETGFSIVIEKSKRALRLCEDQTDGGRTVKTYRVALGSNPSVAKTREGDGATPEGEYYITHRNGASRYYLSLGISYPNANDAAQGYFAGVITSRRVRRYRGRDEKGRTAFAEDRAWRRYLHSWRRDEWRLDGGMCGTRE